MSTTTIPLSARERAVLVNLCGTAERAQQQVDLLLGWIFAHENLVGATDWQITSAGLEVAIADTLVPPVAGEVP